jgi:hypothetical protein
MKLGWQNNQMSVGEGGRQECGALAPLEATCHIQSVENSPLKKSCLNQIVVLILTLELIVVSYLAQEEVHHLPHITPFLLSIVL